MTKHVLCCAVAAAFLAAVPAAGQSTITCGPLDNGRVADVFYKSNAVFFDPVVEYEYEFAVLTVAGPCETLTKTFKPGEEVFFDLAEVERTLDGQYEWELRFMPAVDSGVRKELHASRGSGEEDDLWWSFWQKGAIPDGPRVDSAGFRVVKGAIIDPNSDEERQKSSTVATKSASAPLAAATAGFDASGGTSSQEDSGSGEGGNVLATKDTVLTNVDGTIRNSLCVGFDCLNDNTYSDSTILLTENNTRIKFDDTSTSGSFPRRDWEIQANSNANGGGTWLAINDCGEGTSGGGCADDPVFLVEGNSPANSIRVDSSGRVGFGTANPIVELHTASGDTPTLRLDQNTSSGFAAQVWDIAGNETSFFVRDASNGSTLPFRIFPGSPSNTLVVRNGDVGVGTLSPQVRLDVQDNAGSDVVARIQNESATGFSGIEFLDHNNAVKFFFGAINSDGSARLNSLGGGHLEMRTSNTERLRIAGNGNIGVGGVTSPIHPIEHTSGAHLTSGGAWINGSSRETKQDVSALSAGEAMAAFVDLEPVKFRYSTEVDEQYIGFIAEDVPELVATADRKGLSPMDVVAVMTKIVQEQQKVITRMEGELGSKDDRLDQLQSELELLKAAVASIQAH